MSRIQPQSAEPSWREIAAEALQGLRDGRLTLRHVIGLTDEEMAALTELAEQHRRAGCLESAAEVYGMLAAYDPLQARYWQALAGLYERMGNPLTALCCHEVVGLVAGRSKQLWQREARCLDQLGERELAQEVAAIEETDAAEEETANLSRPRAR